LTLKYVIICVSVCYLFAGQSDSKTAEIVINQDDQFFQNLSEKQYWQSNKVPMPLTMNKTTGDYTFAMVIMLFT